MLKCVNDGNQYLPISGYNDMSLYTRCHYIRGVTICGVIGYQPRSLGVLLSHRVRSPGNEVDWKCMLQNVDETDKIKTNQVFNNSIILTNIMWFNTR